MQGFRDGRVWGLGVKVWGLMAVEGAVPAVAVMP